jgi:hypothetical protein
VCSKARLPDVITILYRHEPPKKSNFHLEKLISKDKNVSSNGIKTFLAGWHIVFKCQFIGECVEQCTYTIICFLYYYSIVSLHAILIFLLTSCKKRIPVMQT